MIPSALQARPGSGKPALQPLHRPALPAGGWVGHNPQPGGAGNLHREMGGREKGRGGSAVSLCDSTGGSRQPFRLGPVTLAAWGLSPGTCPCASEPLSLQVKVRDAFALPSTTPLPSRTLLPQRNRPRPHLLYAGTIHHGHHLGIQVGLQCSDTCFHVLLPEVKSGDVGVRC